jgi:putative ABC transport system permease protein
MTLVGFAANNLARRPARTLLTILGIALAVGTAVALLALGRGITEGVARGLDEHGAELVVAPRTAADIMSARMPEEMGKKLAAIKGVANVAGELFAFAVTGEGHHVLAAAWSPDAPAWSHVPLAAGRIPTAGERALIVGDVLAQSLGFSVGSTVDLFDETFEVVGISHYSTAVNRSLAIMPLAALQEAALRPAQVSLFLVQLNPGLARPAREKVKQAIAASLPVVVSETQEVLAEDGNFATLLAVSDAVSLIAFAMGALNLLATLLMSVQERTREIGMMAAMGWGDRRIVTLIVMEALIIGIAGCTGGVVIGIATSRLFDTLPTIGSVITFTPTFADLGLPLVLALPLCALGAAYPAWRAVHLRPADALRSL